jgi:site-specific recombinase XerD
MQLLRAPLAEFDVRVAPVGHLQGRLAEEAGIQEVSRRQKLSRRKVTPHILRHSHVVNALMAGVPVPMIQKQVGHKRLSTTEIYATVAPVLVKEAYDLHGFGPVSAWI